MAGQTSPDNLPYPTDGDGPDGPGAFQNLAAAVQAALQSVRNTLNASIAAVATTANLAYLPPRVRAHVDTAVAKGTGATNYAALGFATVQYQSDGGMRPTANPTRFVAVRAGVYHYSSKVVWSQSSTGRRLVQIRRNAGGDVTAGTQVHADEVNPVTSGNTTQQLSDDISLSAGDYLEVFIAHSAGSNLNVQAGTAGSSMAMHWVGPQT